MHVEFHCHTSWSKDSLLSPESLVAACHKKGLDRVFVTDHNRIGGALEAYRLDPELVIVGEEIMTTAGELLAFYVKEGIPGGLSPQEAIRRLREQGAFIDVSHPFDSFRNGSWSREDLDTIISQVDAIEVFNARCMSGKPNTLAQEYASLHNVGGTAGSDAHSAMELGTAVMELPDFSSPESLKEAIRQGKVVGRLSPNWVHLISRWASWRKSRNRS